MKNLLNKALFGGNNIAGGCVALAVVLSFALGCNCGKNFDLANIGSSNPSNSASNTSSNSGSSSEVPSNAVVEGLVKETLDKFGDAVETGDFTELRDYASANFQRTYTAEQVADGFASFTKNKKRVLPILKEAAAKDAEFDRPPAVRRQFGNDVLAAAGKLPTKKHVVGFDFEYVMLGGEWKLLKLVINIP